MIWGKQDNHVPLAGRQLVHQKMLAADLNFTWHEFNAHHAFMRDGEARYDPELAGLCYLMSTMLFNRTLKI
jgi:carboxymethylenebutenolidase